MTRSRRGARKTGGASGGGELFEALPFPVVETTRQGRILRLNARARKLLGISRTATLAGKALPAAVFTRPSRPAARAIVQELQKRNRPLLREGLAVITAKGRRRDVLVQAGPAGDGRLYFALGDVTASVERFRRLLESEAKWFSYIESAPDIILLIDRNRTIRFVNRAPGGKSGQVIGRSILDFVLPPDRPVVRRAVRDVFITGRPACYESRGLTPAGRIAWFAICIGPIRSSGKVLEALLIARDVSPMKKAEAELQLHRASLSRLVREKTAELRAANRKLLREIEERKAAETRLAQSREGLRRLSRRLQEVREEERTALARDIHDEIGSALTGLKMTVDLLGDRHAGNPEFKALQERLKARIDEAMNDARDLIHRLRPPILDDLGLGAAIAWQARVFGERSGIPCRILVAGKALEVPRERATVLFRVFQELLTNIGRHSGATKVDVRLGSRDGRISLRVTDNGRGVPREAFFSPGSLGLLGIRERLAEFGGSFKITRPLKGGTRAEASLPLEGGPG